MKDRAQECAVVPDWFVNPFVREFNFTVYAPGNLWKSELRGCCMPPGDQKSWKGEVVWYAPATNQPNLAIAVEKAYREHKSHGATIVAYVQASVSSQWWRKYAVHSEVFFTQGRPRSTTRRHAPFRDAAVLVYSTQPWYPLGHVSACRAWWDKWGHLIYPAFQPVRP